MLADLLKHAANKNGRSMNAELIVRLQNSFKPSQSLSDVDAKKIANELAKHLMPSK